MQRSADDNSVNSAALDKPRPARTPILTYLDLRRRVRVAAGTLLLLGLVVATGWQYSDPGPSQIKNMEPAKSEPTRVTAADDVLLMFQRFAFNALVLPLIDDVDPPRWTLHAVHWICDGRGDVVIDGQPVVNGDPVPQKTFSVRWNLQRCPPLAGADLLIDGDIELIVSRNGSALGARIAAPGVWVESAAGRHWLTTKAEAEAAQ